MPYAFAGPISNGACSSCTAKSRASVVNGTRLHTCIKAYIPSSGHRVKCVPLAYIFSACSRSPVPMVVCEIAVIEPNTSTSIVKPITTCLRFALNKGKKSPSACSSASSTSLQFDVRRLALNMMACGHRRLST